MNEVQIAIMRNVQDAGGTCDWDTAIAGLSHGDSQRAMVHIRDLEKQNLLKRVVMLNPDTHTVQFTLTTVVD